MLKRCILAMLIITGSLGRSLGQEAAVPASEIGNITFGQSHTFFSDALQEERTVNIFLPEGYHPDSSTVYHTLYLLDGSAHEDYPHIAGLLHFLQLYEIIPPTILVGIANVDRYRDFTYPSQDSVDLHHLPTSGGADRFIRYLAEEVRPYMETHFPVDEHRSLIGQSMGGLLGAELLLGERADLFGNYILVSPSLWWNQQALLQEAAQRLQQRPDRVAKVIVMRGDEHPVMNEVADRLAKLLREAPSSNLTVDYEIMPAENHATILHRAVYRALEILYDSPASEEEKE